MPTTNTDMAIAVDGQMPIGRTSATRLAMGPSAVGRHQRVRDLPTQGQTVETLEDRREVRAIREWALRRGLVILTPATVG